MRLLLVHAVGGDGVGVESGWLVGWSWSWRWCWCWLTVVGCYLLLTAEEASQRRTEEQAKKTTHPLDGIQKKRIQKMTKKQLENVDIWHCGKIAKYWQETTVFVVRKTLRHSLAVPPLHKEI